MKQSEYHQFLEAKSQRNTDAGFEPVWVPDFLFDFQKSMTEWSIRKGRAAVFADCGLGKTPLQLVWAENVVRHTNRPVLILTPLAVAAQTVREAQKFGIECRRSNDGKAHSGINVTNYEKLHHFDPSDFSGVVCDESSAIKSFGGARQKTVTEFMRKMDYRSLWTATAAPNDYIELGTSAEALGHIGRMDMLSRFFKNDENSIHPIWWGARWRLKAHAKSLFWRWVCSWARAIRKPSDLGFDDGRFELPPLRETQHIVEKEMRFTGELFPREAVTLDEQREERRETLKERCEKVAELTSGHAQSLVWCHLNPEGDLLEKVCDGAVQVSGADPDEVKEERLLAFADGQIKTLVTKPVIGAQGLNFQRCSHMTFFPSHSFEQYYQGVRRCWRFGQSKPVHVDVVTTPGEMGVLKNLQRKSLAADEMFSLIVREMNNEANIERSASRTGKIEVPSWL
jgi:hypothetical protein